MKSPYATKGENIVTSNELKVYLFLADWLEKKWLALIKNLETELNNITIGPNLPYLRANLRTVAAEVEKAIQTVREATLALYDAEGE